MAQLRLLRRSPMSTGEQLQERAQELLGLARDRNLLMFALVSVSSFTMGLLFGMMTAPSSGSEMRGRIGERASGAMESVRSIARKKGEEIAEEAERIA